MRDTHIYSLGNKLILRMDTGMDMDMHMHMKGQGHRECFGFERCR